MNVRSTATVAMSALLRNRLRSLLTILGVVAGNLIWGVPGMFLAIPFIAILKIIFEHIEYMQPWAILLGDVTMKRKAKPVIRKGPDPVSE